MPCGAFGSEETTHPAAAIPSDNGAVACGQPWGGRAAEHPLGRRNNLVARMTHIELLQRTEDGTVVNVRRRHINGYIKEVMGERFSAKDFRTWAGTLIAACALAREEVEGRSDRRKMIVAAVKETAAQLGNTPAVCKASYIWPSVLHSFEKGTVVKTYFKTMEEQIAARSHGAERALLELLKTGRSAAAELPKRARETKMSRRMRRSPRARRLAKAFTLH